jgi:hypothetical protein
MTIAPQTSAKLHRYGRTSSRMSRITPVSAKAIQRPPFPHVRWALKNTSAARSCRGFGIAGTLVRAERFVPVTTDPGVSHAISRVVDERFS